MFVILKVNTVTSKRHTFPELSDESSLFVHFIFLKSILLMCIHGSLVLGILLTFSLLFKTIACFYAQVFSQYSGF